MPKKERGGPERPSNRPTDLEALTTKPIENQPTETEHLPGIRVWEASYERETGKPNEDAFFQDLDDQGRSGTFLVADGIGGKACGEIASALIKERVKIENGQLRGIQRLRRANNTDIVIGLDGKTIQEETVLKEILEAANRDIFERGKKEIDKRGMGSTATLARLIERPSDGVREVIFAHCGDTRLALLDPEGNLRTLTLDMQAVLEFIQDRQGFEAALASQTILDDISSPAEYKNPQPFLSADMVKTYFNLRARVEYSLGSLFKIQTGRVEVPSGSRLILTTDGIHDNLYRREIAAILSGNLDQIEDLEVRHAAEVADQPTDRLVWAAQARANQHGRNPRSKGRDDMTAIVVET